LKITPDIAKTLKYYVYVYTDPRNGAPFYIGKGKGNRVFEHLHDSANSEKTSTIRAIREAGAEPQIDILRHGLTEAEAYLVEASIIDLIGLPRLTNKMAGHHSRSFGRIGKEELDNMLNPESVGIRHKALLITISRLYRSNMSEEELYEATRGVWRLGDKRNSVEYAMAVYQGIVREVYQIKKWHPAGSLPYNTRNPEEFNKGNRWEFEGCIATDIRDEYIDKFVGKGGQNPIRYVNV